MKKKENLNEPTKEDRLVFIKLYIRFLKNRKLFHHILKVYDGNVSFIECLYKLEPTWYFTCARDLKHWEWSDLQNVGFTNELMYMYHEEWFKILNKNGVKEYKWK